MKGAKAEVALADVLVEVSAAGEGGFGVVEMQGTEVGEADYRVELGEGGLEGGGGAKVVAGGESVASVETDADARFVLDLRDDVADVLKGQAYDVAACGHVLEDGDHGAGFLVRTIQTFCYARDGFCTRMWSRVSGVEVVELYSKRITTFEVVEEGGIGLFGLIELCLGKIDEIGAVRENMLV